MPRNLPMSLAEPIIITLTRPMAYAQSVPVDKDVAACTTDFPNIGNVFEQLPKRSETEDWDSSYLSYLKAFLIFRKSNSVDQASFEAMGILCLLSTRGILSLEPRKFNNV